MEFSRSRWHWTRFPTDWASNERGVGVQEEDVGAVPIQQGEGAGEGVGGAEGLGLLGVFHGVSQQVPDGRLVGRRDDDDDPCHSDALKQVDGVSDEFFAADPVKRLGKAGLHAGTFPGREDDSDPIFHGVASKWEPEGGTMPHPA